MDSPVWPGSAASFAASKTDASQAEASQALERLLTKEEYALLMNLRKLSPAQNPPSPKPSFGARIADKVAATMGSWPFILVQSSILALWIALNVVGVVKHWDPYPFILLNLALSFQAAYAAPFIMMSQNRQAIVDRQEAHHDYTVNTKAELEVELLHEKISALQSGEIAQVLRLLQAQQGQLDRLRSLIESQQVKG